MTPLSLYLHIPFCEVKCGYCDFFSIGFRGRYPSTYSGHRRSPPEQPPSEDSRNHHSVRLIGRSKSDPINARSLSGGWDYELVEAYVDALIREIDTRSPEFSGPVETIFFGGGTPSLLNPQQLERIFSTLKKYFQWGEQIEITVEANPKTVSREKLAVFRSLGVNRLSIGVQSFQDKFLKVMGRIHSGEEAKKTVYEAREAGFKNVSIDLIYALPGETRAEFESDLEKALSLGTKHLSLYHLTIEQGTPFQKMYETGLLSLPEEGDQCWMFERVGQIEGFSRYEISNLAKPGFECRHNLNYWNYGEYLGFGAGAVSFLPSPPNPLPYTGEGNSPACRGRCPEGTEGADGRRPGEGFGSRCQNVRDLKKYLVGQWEQETEEIPIATAMREFLMMGLRKREGISLERFSELFGQSLEESFPNQLCFLYEGRWLERTGDTVRLSSKGIPVANEVLTRFY